MKKPPLMCILFFLVLSQTVSSTDWWPTFRHDAAHTGYSTSQVNLTNFGLKWNYTAGADVYSSPTVVNDRLFVAS